MATIEKYTRVKRPSLFEIPLAYQNQRQKSKSCTSFVSAINIIFTPIRFLIRVLAVLILTPVLTIAFIFAAITIAIPSRIVRRLVSYVGHLVDPDLGKLLSANGTIPARDYADWPVSPSQSITVVIKLKGQFESLDHLRKFVLKRSVHRLNDMKDELEYPELQQYVTKKFGYLFFKWDRNFDIKNHVNIFHSRELLPDPENTVVNEERLTEIWEYVSTRPYPSKRSAWEILMIPNYFPRNNADNLPMTMEEFKNLPKSERRSAAFIRFHHGYCDGVSIYRFLLTLTEHGLDIWEKEYAQRRLTKWQTFKINMYGLMFGPYALAKQMSGGLDLRNVLHPHWSHKLGKSRIVRVTLPVDMIKNARKAHNEVSFHSILIAGITGGVRSYFLKKAKGIPFTPVKIGVPIPKPGHSAKLRNEYLSSVITLPVELGTGRKRIYACEKRLAALKRGALAPFLTVAVNLIGGMPVELARFLTKKADFSVLYSEMKGPHIQLKVDEAAGIDLEDLLYSFGLGCDDLGVGFNSLSYNGKIHLILSVDQGVVRDKEDVKDLMRLIEKEIESLQYGDCTNL